MSMGPCFLAIVARKKSQLFSPIWHFYEVKVAKHLSRLVRTGVAKQGQSTMREGMRGDVRGTTSAQSARE